MSSKKQKVQTALTALSQRTRTPLPALLTSFAILHELTALAPLLSVFYLSRHFSLGEHAVSRLRAHEVTEPWVSEADAWTARVGRRYGLFGYQKRDRDRGSSADESEHQHAPLAGDVANALVAYCATKALLPARVALSLYFAPAFSRRLIHPLSRSVRSLFKHRQQS